MASAGGDPAAARWLVAALGLLISVAAVSGRQSGELVERTLAIVGGRAVTLLDVRAAMALRLVDVPAESGTIEAATRQLVERELVLREVQRYAPAEPSPAAIDGRVAEITARLGSPEALHAALSTVAFSEARLRDWARDDLRIAAYLDQRFAMAGSAERRAELVRDWIADIRRRTPVVELKPQ